MKNEYRSHHVRSEHPEDVVEEETHEQENSGLSKTLLSFSTVSIFLEVSRSLISLRKKPHLEVGQMQILDSVDGEGDAENVIRDPVTAENRQMILYTTQTVDYRNPDSSYRNPLYSPFVQV